MKVSVLVPLYNEEEFVATLLERVIRVRFPNGLEREIIVADDASTDGSVEQVEAVAARHPGLIRLLRTDRNRGKRAALSRAIAAADGDFSIIQDADLEYDPSDYPRLLGPLLDGRADVVYGSRFVVAEERRVLYFWHSLANRILTGLCNMFSDLNLTDMETCYKAFRTPLLKSIPIRSRRFGFEPEITIKVARRQARIFEVPISYNGRTYDEGKKIGAKDAFEAMWVILKCALKTDIYFEKDKDVLDAFSDAPRFNQWMVDTVRPYIGASVLEIGAGIGNISRVLVRKRKRYIATDLDQEHIDRLRNRIGAHGKLETAVVDASCAEHFRKLGDGAVDTVVMLNVLEHIDDDLGTLRNLYSTLQENGRAIVLVPEGQSIYNGLDEELGHRRRYSEAQLRAGMEQVGFVVEAVIPFNRISRPGWWLSGRVMKRRRIGRVQLKLFDKLVWLFRWIDPHLPWPPTSIIAVGRKPEAAEPVRVRAMAAGA